MIDGRTATRDRHLRTLFGLGAAGALTDGQLLERFALGGGEPGELAFAVLVERHGPMVLRVARSGLGDDHLAHDAFQATFLILARKARSLWVRDSLGPWLHAVARRVAAQARAAEARRRRHERGAAGPEAARGREPDLDDLARAIHEEVDRLPDRFRSAVVLCHLEGLTQHEAARRLGWPVGTLQSRLARGRARLRERLGRRGLAPSMAAFPALPVPDALLASTARAAASLLARAPIAGMTGPAVPAMIHATTKGMLMTKLKLGALLGIGLVGSSLGLQAARTGEADPKAPAPTAARTAAPTADPSTPVPVAVPATPPGLVEPQAAPTVDPPPALLQPVPAAPRREGQPPPPAPIAPNPVPPLVANPGETLPTLLFFHATWSEPDRQMRPVIDDLTRAGYPVRLIDIDKFPDLVERYEITDVPRVIITNRFGDVRSGLTGLMDARTIASLFDDVRSRQAASRLKGGQAPRSPEPLVPPPPATPSPKPEGDGEPPLTDLAPPRPWETAVRVRHFLNPQATDYASGAVIKSTPEESIILTVARNFRSPFARGVYQGQIQVDLFDGKLRGTSPAQVSCVATDIPAEIVDINPRLDLALIRIRPGRLLPASPVVPAGWSPNASSGAPFISVGCTHGADATAWSTTIISPHTFPPREGRTTATFDKPGQARPTPDLPDLLMCDHRPLPGRSGGGLYTADGHLAGICLYGATGGETGFYAAAESIQLMLDRNGMAEVYGGNPPAAPAPTPIPAPTPTRTPGEPPSLPAAGGPVPTPASAPARPSSIPKPIAEPPPAPPVSDRRRLDELERKLDQVIESLKDIRGDFQSPRPR